MAEEHESTLMPQPRTPPNGFTIRASEGGAVVIEHRRTGMWAMNGFLIFWLAFWTVGCCLMLQSVLPGAEAAGGKPVPIAVVLGFWAAELFVAGLLLFLLFAQRSYRLDGTSLTAELRVFRFQRVQRIRRDSITLFRQIKDGGKAGTRDSFPSWGLEVEANGKEIGLLCRQPREKSQWLGQVLAAWAEVPFEPASGP